MVICDGRTAGDHCCHVEGQVCRFLTADTRCSIWDRMGGPEWQAAPIGRAFAVSHPGYTCRDWPQNIPEVMAGGGDKCCWEDSNGNVGP